MGHVARCLRRANFGHRDFRHLRQVIAKRSVELAQPAHAQRHVIGPAALVKCSAGGDERSFDVDWGGIGGDANLLSSRWVDVGVGRTLLGDDELTVDCEAGLLPAHDAAPTRGPGVNLMGRLVHPVTLEEWKRTLCS